MEYRQFDLELRQVEEEGIFSGIANAFDVIDDYGSTFDPGAFKKTLNEQDTIPLVWFHDPTKPIGAAADVSEKSKGLMVNKGKLNLDVPLAQDIYSGMKHDPPYITQMSIGFETIKAQDDEEGIEHKKEAKLFEISPLTKNFAANAGSNIGEVRSMAQGIKRINQAVKDETEQDLREAIAGLRQLLDGYEIRANVRGTARTPEYSSTTEGDWSRRTLSEYADQRGWDVDTIDDMSQEQKSTAANSSLLGRIDADNWSELTFFQVVDGNGKLYKNALVAVKTGRGEAADIPGSAYDSAVNKANQLLEDEFDVEQDEEESIDELLTEARNKVNARLDGGSRDTTFAQGSPHGSRDAGADPHLVEEIKRAAEKLN